MIGHIDVSTGASGDKIVCALLQAAKKLDLYDESKFIELFDSLTPNALITFSQKHDGAICGLGMQVTARDIQNSQNIQNSQDTKGDAHHHNCLPYNHAHTNWKTIKSQLESWRQNGSITKCAFDKSTRAFEIIAAAEAQVHGVEIENVTFHEVGAIDSIVDIIGASVLLDVLNIKTLCSSIVTLGYGTVECAHGILPVPAPATALICVDMPVQAGANAGELTTPTGAALLKANVARWCPAPPMVPSAIGTGFGTKTIPQTPNALRIVVGTSISALNPECKYNEQDVPRMHIEGCVLLQTNIDHISPENAASCCEELLDAGALDVWQEPIVMKKGRLGSLLNVLTKPLDTDCLCEAISKYTGSLGIRRRAVERSVAPRKFCSVNTRYGNVNFKLAWPDEPCKRQSWVRPEHDDVARIARTSKRSFIDIEEELLSDFALSDTALYDSANYPN